MTRRMTVVLDDDPTGTQSARDVPVLLDPEADPTMRRRRRGVRAHQHPGDGGGRGRGSAAAPSRPDRRHRGAGGVRAARRFDAARPRLRRVGRVHAATCCCSSPAFPAGGRTTVDGVHYVSVDGRRRVAADTEFAADPVFGYRARTLPGWVREVGGRDAYPVGLAALRAAWAGHGGAGPARGAGFYTVVVPDAETDDDLAVISAGLDRARAAGRTVTLRCAAPLAAMRAGRHTARPVSPPYGVATAVPLSSAARTPTRAAGNSPRSPAT